MADPTRSPTSDSGFIENGRALFSAIAAYLGARLHLAGIETKEALVHFGIIAGLAIVALCVVVFGYLFFCIGLVFLIARLLHVHAEWVVLVLALAHFGVAMACIVFAKARLSASMFSATLQEFKKDKQWLQTKKQS